CVAPKRRATGSLPACTSAAMIGLAPASRAPCTAFKPTPPQPSTTTLLPEATAPVLTTAPTPATTAPASRAAPCRGTPAGMGTTCDSWTTVSSANVAVANPGRRESPRALRSRPGASPGQVASHMYGAPVVQ